MQTFEPIPAATLAVRNARRNRTVQFEEGQLGDIERDALAEGLPLWRAKKAGFLYLAANASWPGLYKFGCTRRAAVDARIAELGGSARVTPWIVVATWSVYDAHGLEALVKRACAKWQHTGEVYHASFMDLTETVNAVVAADRANLDKHVGPAMMPGALDDCLGEICYQEH